MTTFACKLTDADLVRACATEQPAEVRVGQEWMSVGTGQTYPVKAIRGNLVDLGSKSFTLVMEERFLRLDYVCVDVPENVTDLPNALGRSAS